MVSGVQALMREFKHGKQYTKEGSDFLEKNEEAFTCLVHKLKLKFRSVKLRIINGKTVKSSSDIFILQYCVLFSTLKYPYYLL